MSKSQLFSGETIDNIGPFKIIQKKNGYRFSEDPILLAEFATPLSINDTVLDIGTGSGIIPLLLAYKTSVKKIVGVEIQDNLAKLAIRNISLNGLAKRVKILRCDFRELKRVFKGGSFSVVLSNPPYARAGSGRICPDPEKSIARHEMFGTLQELVQISRYLLKPKGMVFYIYPTARLQEVVSALTTEGLEVTRLKFAGTGKAVKCFLIEAGKK
ncbi:MAG: methyltransferase domain-containing protein [Deltaproteobacteria bacterium]|nr:methyltransferase domain-containing protein [Deltaproteobacteria bacterium]